MAKQVKDNVPPFPMVRIEWVDSSAIWGWVAHHETSEWNLSCVTAGFLLEDQSEMLVIADSLAFDTNGDVKQVYSPQAIPKVAVTRITYLTEKRK